MRLQGLFRAILTPARCLLSVQREAFKVHLAACGAGIDDESLLDSKVPPGSMGQALDEEIAQLDRESHCAELRPSEPLWLEGCRDANPVMLAKPCHVGEARPIAVLPGDA